METVETLKCCPKCGRIQIRKSKRCKLCGTELFEIDPKWGITQEKHNEFFAGTKHREKTRRECAEEFYKFCEPFFENVLKKCPEFDQELFDTLIDREEAMLKEEFQEIEEWRARLEKGLPTSSYQVACPECGSYYTKKIPPAEPPALHNLFGLICKKGEKKWRCGHCYYRW